MQFLAVLATLAVAAPALASPLDNPLASRDKSPLSVNLYSDGNCQNMLTMITLDPNSCHENNSGFSSFQITANGGNGGVITAYTKDNCGDPAGGSHGYTPENGGCGKDFPFVANALGYHD